MKNTTIYDLEFDTWIQHFRNGTGTSLGQRPDENGKLWGIVVITDENGEDRIYRVNLD
jgi:hypothetical protein